MNAKLAIDELGATLVKYIKEQSPYTLAEVADRTLGITYSNFQKRLSKNNIKLHELKQILEFLEIDIQITIADMTFQRDNPSQPSQLSPTNYEELIAQKDRLLQLQDKIIQLQEELETYRKKP